MKKLSLAIIFMICIAAAALLAGCKHAQILPTQNVGTGGTSDHTNYDAPKEINSGELTFFETDFYRESDYVYDVSRSYRFKMTKSEGNVFVITEGYDEKLKCETDETFAAELQQVIREYDLVRLNGIEKQTYGLPPEYGPCWLRAEYASNEQLYFFMNGDPYAEWTGAVLDLFAKEFGKHGMEDLLPPKEESAMTRFSLDYAFGDRSYRYSEIWIPVTEEEKARSFEDVATYGRNLDDCVKKAYGEIWDRTAKKEVGEERRADITEELYQALKEIVEETEMNRFQNGQIFPGSFDFENTPQYYEFYIEYESGKIMSGFSDDPEQCEKFKPIAERLSQYYEEYLENNKD